MYINKFCASGNDFLIFYLFNDELKNKENLAKKLCNRFYGLGADGMVILSPSKNPDAHYKWEFFNSDGSTSSMCGNASRCVSFYAFLNKLAPCKHSFLSESGLIETCILESNINTAYVRSTIGIFEFKKQFKARDYIFYVTNMSIPHIVCFVNKNEFNKLYNDLEFLKKLRQEHNSNINIAFSESDHIVYATYERGVENITQSCGTGACAVYSVWNLILKNPTIKKLIPPSKEILNVGNENNKIFFSGKVHKVFETQIDI